uniref:hypothetical protein n=1 Tax=Rothia dentocariosa TaxID=2047 RepID=UPI003FA3A679
MKSANPTAWNGQRERSRPGNPRQISEQALEPAGSGRAHPARHPEGQRVLGR